VQRVCVAPAARRRSSARGCRRAGDLYESTALDRAARDLVRTWRADGYLDATAEPRAVRVGDGAVAVCFRLAQGPAWTVTRNRRDRPCAPRARGPSSRRSTRTTAGERAGQAVPRRSLELQRAARQSVLYDHGMLTSKVGRRW